MAKKKTEVDPDIVDVINRALGDGVIRRMDDAPIQSVDVISSGSIGLDRALGVGGLPRGRIIEIWGMESSGKTTLALHAIANAQKQDLVAAFVDAEHALDLKYARALGVDTDALLVSQPDYGEQALEVVEMLCRSGSIGIVVIDSVAALTPKAEIEGDMGQSHMGLQARLMSQAMRKLVAIAHSTKTLVYFINQTRMKIGVVYGSPVTTTGGNALKFYASVRLNVKRIGKVKDGAGEAASQIGNRTKVIVAKNKLAPPFAEAEFDIDFGLGISRVGEIVDLGVECGAIDKAGAWLSFGGDRVGQGRHNAKKYFDDNPEIADAVEQIIRGGDA